MARSKIHPDVERALDHLAANWRPLGQAETMPPRLRESICDYYHLEENRHANRIKAEALAKIRRTLKHVLSALCRAADKHVESHKARKFLKTLGHERNFGRTIERAKCLAGEIQKEAKRRARKESVCRDEVLRLTPRRRGAEDVVDSLARVTNIHELQAVCRALGLCAAKNDRIGKRYHRKLREPSRFEFWKAQSDTVAVGLVLVEVSDSGREVVECQMAEGAEFRCRYRGTHLEILRKLDASADEVDEFTRRGAFRAFASRALSGRKPLITIGGCRHEIWTLPGELIIRSSNGSQSTFSRFARASASETGVLGDLGGLEQVAWHEDAMSIEQLMELAFRSKRLNNACRAVFVDP